MDLGGGEDALSRQLSVAPYGRDIDSAEAVGEPFLFT